MTYEVDQSPILDTFTLWTRTGIYNATSVLSGFMGAELEHSEPLISLTSIDNLTKMFNWVEREPSVCLLQALSGGLHGFFLFAASTEVVSQFTQSLSSSVLPSRPLTFAEFDLTQSIINEWANIFAGNVISSIESTKVGIIELTSTEQTYDMSGAALDFVACQMGVETDLIVLCHTNITIKGSHQFMNVWIILSPDSQIFKLQKSEVNIKQP